jgi:hypothetical protein
LFYWRGLVPEPPNAPFPSERYYYRLLKLMDKSVLSHHCWTTPRAVFKTEFLLSTKPRPLTFKCFPNRNSISWRSISHGSMKDVQNY